ncbi:MAG: hypothetical protein KAW39_07755 [Thermoplasmata archaeon]|nr:hypothetical protein [Thermoplasmata archaeon]
MSEGRIFPGEYIEVQIRFLLAFVGWLVFIIIFAVAMEYWMAQHLEAPHWLFRVIWMSFGYVSGIVLLYCHKRAMRSRAKFVEPRRIHYEGWAFNSALPIAAAMAFFLGISTLYGSILSLLEGDQTGLFTLIAGAIFLLIAVYALLLVFRSRLLVDEEGLLWRHSLLRSTPLSYIPFDELDSIRLKGRTLSFRAKTLFLRGHLIVQNPRDLRPLVEKVRKGERL